MAGLLFKLGILAILPFVALPLLAALIAPFYYDGTCETLSGEFWACSIGEYAQLQMMFALLLPGILNVAYILAIVAIYFASTLFTPSSGRGAVA